MRNIWYNNCARKGNVFLDFAYNVYYRAEVLFRRAPTKKWRVLKSGELLPKSGGFKGVGLSINGNPIAIFRGVIQWKN